MNWKVMFLHSDKSHRHKSKAEIREGREIYRHPEGRFVVLEFQGKAGNFREAFWPNEILKTEG